MLNALGLTMRNGAFDVSVVAKNALNKQYLAARTWNSWTPGYPSWYGLQLNVKFY